MNNEPIKSETGAVNTNKEEASAARNSENLEASKTPDEAVMAKLKRGKY